MAYDDKLALKPRPQGLRERGIVLPVALFLLVGATLLTLGLIRSNVISLKIGGASVVASETQAAAEWVLGNFFGRNPVDTDVGRGRYQRSNSESRCLSETELSTVSSKPLDDPLRSRYFDCTKPTNSDGLPSGVTVSDLSPQRIDCGPPVRSQKVYQANTVFNNVLIEGRATNTWFGSEGRVGAGVVALVTICPQD